MKNYLFPIFALLVVGCGNSTRPSTVKKDSIRKTEQNDLDSVKICRYFALEKVPTFTSAQEIDYLNELMSCIKPDTIYHNSEDIDNELGALRANYSSYPAKFYDWDVFFEHRLEYHLSNPLTFKNDLPQLSSALSRYISRDYIFYTPDKKFKFYCLSQCFCGSADIHKTYVQYLDSFGKVKWTLFDDFTEEHWGGYIFDKAWQYTDRNTTYYVLHFINTRGIEFDYCKIVLNVKQLESAAKSSVPYSHYNENQVEWGYFDDNKDFIKVCE